jgi:hypothetical protein
MNSQGDEAIMTQADIRRAIDEDRVHAVVRDWFRAFNGETPVEEILRFFIPEGLVIRLPEATLRSHDDIRQWWQARSSRAPRHIEVPQEVGVRITSPIHADVTMRVIRRAQNKIAGSATVNWSLVARHGAPRVRTYLVHPSPVSVRVQPRPTEGDDPDAHSPADPSGHGIRGTAWPAAATRRPCRA